jgi:hypothetical protein
MSLTHHIARAGIAAAVLALSACGGSDGNTGAATKATTPVTASSNAATDPCSVTTTATITKAFGGTVAEGTPGHARNCEYAVSGGAASTVEIFAYGTAAEFDGIRSGYETNRGPLEEIAAIGEHAFSPGDVGQNEVVVQAGGIVFAVGINAVSAGDVAPEVKELAGLIAQDLT